MYNLDTNPLAALKARREGRINGYDEPEVWGIRVISEDERELLQKLAALKARREGFVAETAPTLDAP